MNKICIIIRRFLYITIGFIDKIFGVKPPKVTVLCYHSIANDWFHSVEIAEFIKQIEYLKKNYDIISVAELESFLNNEKEVTRPSILLTFDDGYKDILAIKDILISLNIKPLVFLIGDPKNVNRVELDNDKELLNKNEVNELVSAGFDFGYHTKTHPNLLKISDDEVDEEIRNTDKFKYLAFPKGRYNSNVLGTTKKYGYRLGFTMDDGFIQKGLDRYMIPRIGMNMTHSMSEFKYMLSPDNTKVRNYIKRIFPNFI